MLLNREASMTAMDPQTYVRRRKRKRAEHDQEIPHFQGSLVEDHSLKREEKEDPILEDESAKRLINLELDVAEALAEFWRMAREPSRQGKFNVHLRWSRKRLRSSLFKDSIAPCKPKEEPEDASSSAKNRSSCLSERDSSFSDKDEIESSRMSKDSSQFDSRAESPSSPLPSVQLPCGTFLHRGSPAAKSAFQRVLPLQRRCLIPVKSEIEDVQLERFDGRPQNASVRQKSKSSKCAMSRATLKEVPLDEQIIDFRDCRGAASSEDLKVKSEECWVSDLTVLNKPKSALNEKEKEARRLRRIEANRESARQTIRRKQVVCEELMKKASSLSFENERMKQKRESLMQELFCLRGQNYHLKQQLEMEASANLGLLPAEIPLKRLSESVSVPAFQVPSLPYAGVPVHSFAWVMAAAQAAAANQAYTFLNKEKTLDALQTNLGLPQQAAALALPVMTSSKETSVLRIVEQGLNYAFNGVCSPASMGRSSQKEMGCVTSACTEICTLQSEEATCDPCSSTTPVADPCSTVDPPEELARVQANCLLSQPPSLITCSTKAGLDTMPTVAEPHESMEGYLGPPIAQGIRCGYTYNGGRGGHFLIAHSQTNALIGRNHFAIMAAAEARKRRKELTRHKFSRSRALRLALQAGNTKEI